jgi:hypothetical protein
MDFLNVSRVDRDLEWSIRHYAQEDLSLVNSPWRLGIYRFLGIDSLPFAKALLLQTDSISLDRVC